VSNPDERMGPTRERLRMAAEDEIEIVSAIENEHWQAVRLLDNHPLEYLRRRECITGDQYSAGQQFYSDWYFGGLAASGVIDPGRVIVDGGQIEPAGDRRLFALSRWQKAVRQVGKVHSTTLIDLILTEQKLHAWGARRFNQANRERARQAAITALVLALEQLDVHYHGNRRNQMRAALNSTGSAYMRMAPRRPASFSKRLSSVVRICAERAFIPPSSTARRSSGPLPGLP